MDQVVEGHTAPPLPYPRGPLSEDVLAALSGDGPRLLAPPIVPADAFGDDSQLALYVCYELHYRGFAGVDPDWEWEPTLLRTRAALEDAFLTALRDATAGGRDPQAALAALLGEDVNAYGVSHHLRDAASWSQVCDYVAIRSTYHLKEADPHAWVIPRLQGRAKAALVAVEYDEFGGGRAERMHAQMYADLMAGLGLDPRYGHYLNVAPAEALAVVNLMSMSGLHRRLRGVLVGHFAAAEVTTAPSAARIAAGLQRLGADPRCVDFFTEHVEADAVHEQVLRHDVVDGLLGDEPSLAADLVLGVQATELLEERLSKHLLGNWQAGRSALHRSAAPTPS